MLKSLVKGIQTSIRKGATTVHPGTFIVIRHDLTDTASEVHRSQCGNFYAVASGLDDWLAPKEVYIFRNPKKGFWYTRGIQEIKAPTYSGIFGKKIAFKESYGRRTLLLISHIRNSYTNTFEYAIGFNRWGGVAVVNTDRVYVNTPVRSVVKMDAPYHDRYMVSLVDGNDGRRKLFVTVASGSQKYPVNKEVCETGYTPVNFCLGFNHLYVLYQRGGGQYLFVKYHVRKNDFILEVTIEYFNQFEGTGLIDQNFGASMVLSCDNVLVGAPEADNGFGCIYIFEELNGTTRFFKLKLNDGVGVGTQLFSEKKYNNSSMVIVNDKMGKQIEIPNYLKDLEMPNHLKDFRKLKEVTSMPQTEPNKEETMAQENQVVKESLAIERLQVALELDKSTIAKLETIAKSMGVPVDEVCARALEQSELIQGVSTCP